MVTAQNHMDDLPLPWGLNDGISECRSKDGELMSYRVIRAAIYRDNKVIKAFSRAYGITRTRDEAIAAILRARKKYIHEVIFGGSKE